MTRCCGLGNLHVSGIPLVTGQDVDFHVDFLQENIGYSYAMWSWKIPVGGVLIIDASHII
jgi:hypothetical protein